MGGIYLNRFSGRDWSSRSWNERVSKSEKVRGDRIRSLINDAREKPVKTDVRVHRPGISVVTPTRYSTTADNQDWSELTAGKPAVEAVFSCIEDGRDRLLLAWPERPGNAFTLAAVAAREARASGRLAYATVAVWPWRAGLLRAARSVLVHPHDIATAAKLALNDQTQGKTWVTSDVAHDGLGMIEVRLRDLVPEHAPVRVVRGRGRDEMLVRNPTLLETTTVFQPTARGFQSEPEQVLKRVRDYTFLGNEGAKLKGAMDSVGDPHRAPFAIFGLPAEKSPQRIARHLLHKRFEDKGLDVVVADLTRQSKVELGEKWEEKLASLLEAIATVPGRRPSLLVLCEDPFTFKSASRVVKGFNGRLKPKRQAPEEVGLYLADRGLTSKATPLPPTLQCINFQADIKDASLVYLRDDMLSLMREFRDAGDIEGQKGVSQALSFVRRIASLPVGLTEALDIVDVLYDGDDDVDIAIRSMFRYKMALADLGKSSLGLAKAGPIINRIEDLVSKWQLETPVSAKLTSMLSAVEWNDPSTLVSVPDRRIAEVLLLSDRALSWSCSVVDHKALAEAISTTRYRRLVVAGPSTAALRALLVGENAPPNVVLLGDASGAGLLAGELAPLARLHAFASVAERATALQAALKRGGIDEKLNLDEAEFRVATAQSRNIDLSREGESFSGDKIAIGTGAHRILYRPHSDVLLFESNEARLFQKVAAQDVERGDHILVLDERVRNSVRDALAASTASLDQLVAYHTHIAAFRSAVVGDTHAEKAREVFRRMRALDPALGEGEVSNVLRWLTADLAPISHHGSRQPRAARDQARFTLFMAALGVEEVIATTYWNFAIVPTRSYRVQEGNQFNKRVVQFVLDPESAGMTAADTGLKRLWQSLLDGVDEVVSVDRVVGDRP